MFFVLLSHFAGTFLRSPGQESLRSDLILVGMVASPTFVILSGVLLGVLFQLNTEAFPRIQAKIIDRGLFLLIVGHAVICVPLFVTDHTWTWSLSTDAIGVSMIVGAIAIPWLSGRLRLALGVTAYVVSWFAVYDVVPHESHIEALKELLFGSLNPTVFVHGIFPLVPWMAVYLLGTVLGERLVTLLSNDRARRATLELTVTGASALSAVLTIKLAALWFGFAPLRHASSTFLRVGGKYPPTPLYLLFFGGVGLLLLSAWLYLESQHWCRRILARVGECGQSSLFIFIAHFYVYGLVITHLAPGNLWAGAVYFVASSGLIVVLAREWLRRDCNAMLTVGYEALWKSAGIRLRRAAMTT